jgi:hypothetical protein
LIERALLSGFLASIVAAAPLCASADPRLPKPHHAKTKIQLRWSSGASAFSATSYGTATAPASSEHETLLRGLGTYALSDRWGIEYDLRAATLVKTRHGVAQSATGLEDQLIGVERAFARGSTFADAVAINVLFPTGSTSSAPPLGQGAFAIQPGFEFELRGRGPRAAYFTATAADRLYSAGFGSQWRATAELGAPLGAGIETAALLSYYHSANLAARGPAGYDELRAGIDLRARLSNSVRPFVRYERDLAGRNIHDVTRFSLGLELRT